jgi:hypothetical protein
MRASVDFIEAVTNFCAMSAAPGRVFKARQGVIKCLVEDLHLRP